MREIRRLWSAVFLQGTKPNDTHEDDLVLLTAVNKGDILDKYKW